MANVNYRSQFQYSYCGQQVQLFVQMNIGSTGAVTVQSGTGMGISSIVRNSAGKYTLTLSQAFASLLDVNSSIISGASAPAAPAMNIVTNTVSTSASPQIAIQFRNLAGAATDPASGEKILLSIGLDRSSLGH